MPMKIKADGDTWKARLGERPPSPDVQVVLFFCVTTDQRPYRVSQVSRERVPDAAGLEALSAEELRELFDASQSMAYAHTFHDTPAPS